ncbi:MAG: hypothetical protein OEY14_11535, partial [Myxococcales bacterium]|nr:hypothetical protein [Myxococcales bacterium]
MNANSLRFVACASLLLVAAHARAEVPAALDGLPIVQVRIVGSRARGASVRELGIPIGARLSRRLIRESILRLLESGRYADVQIDAMAAPGGVSVSARLEPRQVLERLDLLGNEVIGDEELRRIAALRAGDELDEERLEQLRTRIERAYAERGHESLGLELEVRDTSDRARKVLVLRIREGEPTRIAALRLRGERPPLEARLRSEIDIDVGDIHDERRIEAAIRAAESSLRARGWLGATLGNLRRERTPAGMILELDCELGPRYELVVRGEAPLERAQIEEILALGEERLSGPAVLAAMRERVLELYRQRGFADVRAEVGIEPGPRAGRARLRVHIAPGRPLRVRAIELPGATHFSVELLREQIRSYLEEGLGSESVLDPFDAETARLVTTSSRPRLREIPAPHDQRPGEVYHEATYARALEHLRELYESAGYLQAQVGPATLERGELGRATVTIPIEAGPRTLLHSVTIEGSEAISAHRIIETSALRRGQPFSYLSLEQARSAVLELYREAGFLFARVEATARFSGDHTRAEVQMRVNERFEVTVGEILIEGLVHTSEALVRAAIPLRSGDVFRPSIARQTQDR